MARFLKFKKLHYLLFLIWGVSKNLCKIQNIALEAHLPFAAVAAIKT